MNANTAVTKIEWNSAYCFWDMMFTSFSGRTNSQTHSRTDTPENRMAPAPKVFGAGVITIK